ncbi:MAG: hypothetical protein V2G33_07130 [bacterium JZ-2024 1]
MPSEEVLKIALAALLHDLGKFYQRTGKRDKKWIDGN